MLRGKTIGFVGDRLIRRGMRPFTVVLGSDRVWKWKEVTFLNDGVAMARERSTVANKGSFWIPTDAAAQKLTIHLPRLIYLPTELIHFCAQVINPVYTILFF